MLRIYRLLMARLTSFIPTECFTTPRTRREPSVRFIGCSLQVDVP